MPATPTTTAGAAVVSAPCAADTPDAIGRENYSYAFAMRRFRPLLDRWGEWRELTRPESRADFALRRLSYRAAFHLTFAPPHAAYLCRGAVNAAFVYWEFPDLPDDDGANPRHNWRRIAGRLDRVLTTCTFTRDAFRRAVDVPVDLVPTPVPEDRFDIPDWDPARTDRLAVPCHVLPSPLRSIQENPWVEKTPQPAEVSNTLQGRVRRAYRATVKPWLPTFATRGVQHGYRTLLRWLRQPNEVMRIPLPVAPALDLSGVVYLHVANPFDPRKNWRDLLTAYLSALADTDATLVLKLVTPAELAPLAVRRVYRHYLDLGIAHRCKLALVADYLGENDFRRLIRASTYYVTATRAEGANLPLMDSLAAGRPAISAAHTAMADYMDGDLGWVVPSSPEPTAFPHAGGGAATTWHRIDWRSLHDQFRESYAAAGTDRYRTMASESRRRMLDLASLDAAWPPFCAALDALTGLARERR